MSAIKISHPVRLAGKLIQIREYFTYQERQIIEASMFEHQFKCFVLTGMNDADCARFTAIFQNAGLTVEMVQ